MGQEQPKGPVVPEKTLKGTPNFYSRASQGIHKGNQPNASRVQSLKIQTGIPRQKSQSGTQEKN